MNWINLWIASWLDMICGLISVVTFCKIRPWWDFSFRCRSTKRDLKKRIREGEGVRI